MIYVDDFLPGPDATPCLTVWVMHPGFLDTREDGPGFWRADSYELVCVVANDGSGRRFTPAQFLELCERTPGWGEGLKPYHDNLQDALTDGSAREQDPVEIGSKAA